MGAPLIYDAGSNCRTRKTMMLWNAHPIYLAHSFTTRPFTWIWVRGNSVFEETG
jgi:hypothetical protein